MHRRHHTDEEIEADRIAVLQARRERFAADASHAHLAVGLIVERVMEVVRQLAVNADRLHPVKHRVA